MLNPLPSKHSPQAVKKLPQPFLPKWVTKKVVPEVLSMTIGSGFVGAGLHILDRTLYSDASLDRLDKTCQLAVDRYQAVPDVDWEKEVSPYCLPFYRHRLAKDVIKVNRNNFSFAAGLGGLLSLPIGVNALQRRKRYASLIQQRKQQQVDRQQMGTQLLTELYKQQRGQQLLSPSELASLDSLSPETRNKLLEEIAIEFDRKNPS
jgi:hypothetical protein